MNMMSDDYAVYLPAVSDVFAKPLTQQAPNNRPLPTNFNLSHLTFWDKNNPYWYHPHYLHSVGQYAVGTVPDNAITRRNKTDGIMIGDSGGFQIGKGTLRGITNLHKGMSADDACAAWRDAYEARRWIIGWLETYTNYALTIDMPLWATLPHGSESPFHLCSQEQLTQLTVENLEFIDSHRQDRTQWLNVIQTDDVISAKKWWDAVKWFPCSGYAMGGNALKTKDLAMLLNTLLFMCDDDAFKPNHNWLHMLGQSTNKWAIVFTAMQQALRKKANAQLRISFDSASPFRQACELEEYVIPPTFGTDANNWKIRSIKCPQSRLDVNSNAPLPFSSPLADKLTLGHLSVRGGMYDKNPFDNLSRMFISHHNVWVYLDAMQRANDIMFASDRSQAPNIFKECVDLISDVIGLQNWASELKKHGALFAQFAKA